jgi:hypothetical protein
VVAEFRVLREKGWESQRGGVTDEPVTRRRLLFFQPLLYATFCRETEVKVSRTRRRSETVLLDRRFVTAVEVEE